MPLQAISTVSSRFRKERASWATAALNFGYRSGICVLFFLQAMSLSRKMLEIPDPVLEERLPIIVSLTIFLLC
jgi:hypothetical protein